MIKNPTLNKKPIQVNRALLSVFDKEGIVELAQLLVTKNIEILSTGGTAKTLRENNIPVVGAVLWYVDTLKSFHFHCVWARGLVMAWSGKIIRPDRV